MNKKKKNWLCKTPGFILSLETLLAATVFSMTCALCLSLVWNGFNRVQDINQRLENVIFLKNKIYELDIPKIKRESTTKKFFTNSGEASINIEIAEPDKTSKLHKAAQTLYKFEFAKKINNDKESVKLVGFFPHSLEED